MEENRSLRKREEVPEKDTWNLADLFPSDEALFEVLASTSEKLKELEAFKGKLGESGKTLHNFLVLQDEANALLYRMAMYAGMKGDQDLANAKYQDMNGKYTKFEVEFYQAVSFMEPEIIEIPEDKLESFYSECKELEVYRRFLKKTRLLKAHTLTDAEERILSSIGEITQGPATIGSVLRNTNMSYMSAVDKEGVEHALTQGTYIPLVSEDDRTLRESAFKNFYAEYKAHIHTYAAILNAQINTLVFNAKTRHYNNTLEASLYRTEVPTDVYFSLIESVHKHLPSMYKYMDIRKKALGVDELHMYDIYNTIIDGVDRKYTYEEAQKIVLEALVPMGEDYLEVVKRSFRERWIDVYENVGKRGGAYSNGSTPHPYMLLNYNETLDAVFTLIHEMGHSLHSYLTEKNQPEIYQNYTMFVAEVASTCNEVILLKHLLSKTENKKERAYLVHFFLDSFRTTLFRQCMFAEFELQINQKVEAGASLTSDLLNQMYLDLNKQYYGPSVVSDTEISYEWARIPHFFYNYYVFQYSTGFSAAVAIANKILKEGKPAVEKYLKFLSSGSSTDPISLLKIADVDMSTPAVVDSALTTFDELVDELEKLI